jgi:hypothetical protein
MSMPLSTGAFDQADRAVRTATGGASCGTMQVVATCVSKWLALFPL